jgi:hypothetical protein
MRRGLLAAAIAALFQALPCQALDLPPAIKQVVISAGLTVNSDGSISAGNTLYVPLLPKNYDPQAAVTGTPTAQTDGSVLWGGLQFAPVVDTPGEMPHLPDNLQVVNSGATLPPDFKPPAGFVPSTGVPLPSGVTVPPLSVQAMVQKLEQAGTLPSGLITFNSDGSVAVKGGSTYLPFNPPTAQQGLCQSPCNRSISVTKDGAIAFPDGTTLAPLVSGQDAGSTTLPSGFTPPSGTSLPATVNLPMQFSIPSSVQIPSGMTLPAGVGIPANYNIPSGTKLPAGVSIPSSATVASDVVVPDGITLPVGTTISTTSLPAGTTVLPNGSVVVPGNKIPSGVTPPATWTPPTGVSKNSDGSYSLPSPPAGGFPPPPMPLKINSDGSAVMPAPPAGAPPPPPGSTINPDGTITIPPPPFIGSISSSGTVQAPTGFTPPPGFTPQVPPGTSIRGAGMPPPTTGGTPAGTPPPISCNSFEP